MRMQYHEIDTRAIRKEVWLRRRRWWAEPDCDSNSVIAALISENIHCRDDRSANQLFAGKHHHNSSDDVSKSWCFFMISSKIRHCRAHHFAPPPASIQQQPNSTIHVVVIAASTHHLAWWCGLKIAWRMMKREAKVALADNLRWASWFCDSIFEASGITFSAHWTTSSKRSGQWCT